MYEIVQNVIIITVQTHGTVNKNELTYFASLKILSYRNELLLVVLRSPRRRKINRK